MGQFIDGAGHSGITGGGTNFEFDVEIDMARRNWFKCTCGAKLHVKTSARKCYKCLQKEHKEKNV